MARDFASGKSDDDRDREAIWARFESLVKGDAGGALGSEGVQDGLAAMSVPATDAVSCPVPSPASSPRPSVEPPGPAPRAGAAPPPVPCADRRFGPPLDTTRLSAAMARDRVASKARGPGVARGVWRGRIEGGVVVAILAAGAFLVSELLSADGAAQVVGSRQGAPAAVALFASNRAGATAARFAPPTALASAVAPASPERLGPAGGAPTRSPG
jgi:hypothetical protein